MMVAMQMNTKRLADLVDNQMLGQPVDERFAQLQVNGLQLDSRKVVSGDLFLACGGALRDGREFIEQAITLGAVAVLAERGEKWLGNQVYQNVPVIVVDQLPQWISEIAGRFYEHPSRQLSLLGVTGTNGKTSCTHLFMQLQNRLRHSCGVIGTLGVGVDGEFNLGINTTPDAIAIQKDLSDWQQSGVQRAAMEVSSHGLEQGRVAALQFEQAIFTNLTRDHLDYHGTMEAYGAAKAELFRMPGLKVAIVNGDDTFAQRVIQQLPESVAVYCYSTRRSGAAASRQNPVNVWVDQLNFHDHGVNAQLHTPWGKFELNSPLLGEFNLSNVLAVIVAAINTGLPAEEVIKAVVTLKTVAGRMERLPSQSGVTAVVDYAHTPDALEHALKAMRQHTRGKLWCVFGCGGDRDQGKRPQMGEVAQRFADHVIVTSDNPRNENPAHIINEILSGIDRPSLVEEDRAKAIAFAIAQAAVGDSVLVAGKGHEDYQQVGDNRLPFSDIKQVRLALAAREVREGEA